MFDNSLVLILDSGAEVFICEFEAFLSVKSFFLIDIDKLILESLIILI